jgi:hypothetical protein
MKNADHLKWRLQKLKNDDIMAASMPKTEPHRNGLGDIVERLIHKVVPTAWIPKKASGCGCAKRKALLNNFKVG